MFLVFLLLLSLYILQLLFFGSGTFSPTSCAIEKIHDRKKKNLLSNSLPFHVPDYCKRANSFQRACFKLFSLLVPCENYQLRPVGVFPRKTAKLAHEKNNKQAEFEHFFGFFFT